MLNFKPLMLTLSCLCCELEMRQRQWQWERLRGHIGFLVRGYEEEP